MVLDVICARNRANTIPSIFIHAHDRANSIITIIVCAHDRANSISLDNVFKDNEKLKYRAILSMRIRSNSDLEECCNLEYEDPLK